MANPVGNERVDTKTAILDAAEGMMADRGIDGTSLRAILSTAGVNSAALHYHFGSRERVVEAILARRGRHQSERRMEMLRTLESRGETPTALDVVDVIVDPMVEMLYEDGEGGRRFLRFLARLQSDRSRVLFREAETHFSEFRERLGHLAAQACPHVPEAGLARRLTMVFDTTLISIASADVMAEAWKSDEHMEALLEHVVTLKRFLVGGLSG